MKSFEAVVEKSRLISPNYRNINNNDSDFTRAGIILFDNRNKRFYLSEDSKSNLIGDFGGRVEKGESPIQAAKREFYEESLGVFGNIDISNSDLVTFNGNHLYIVYIKPLTKNFSVLRDYYRYYIDNNNIEDKYKQSSDLHMFKSHELLNLINNYGEVLSHRTLVCLRKWFRNSVTKW